MVPVETSSGYLANERTLLPEDAVCFVLFFFFFFFFFLLKINMVLYCFVMKMIIIFTILLPYFVERCLFTYLIKNSVQRRHSSYFLLDMYANTSNLIHMCMCTWVHNEGK